MSWLKDPLILFLGVGTIMFFAASQFSDEEISYLVALDEEEVQRILQLEWFIILVIIIVLLQV